jgi:tetratricopeptide (TPR) repeat protein
MRNKLKFIQKRRIALSLASSATLLAWPALSQSDPGLAAVSLERQGKFAEAETAWKAISKDRPSNPEPLAHIGLLEARQEHYTEAITFYKRAMAIKPSMPGLRLNLGIALFKAGDYKSAIETLDPLIKEQPDDQRLTVLIGMSHYGRSQFSEAARYLKRAAEQDPQNLTLLLTLTHSCLLSGEYPCVLDAYHRIIALNPASAQAYMLMGEALDQMKDPIGAVREFRSAIQANPKEPNVHFGLGYLLWAQGQYPEAAQEFQAEIGNDSQHLQAMLYLADSKIQMNQMEEARPLLENLEKINPNNAMIHLDLGIVYADQDRKQEAMAQLQTAVKLAPNNVNAHYRLARIYRSMGMTAQAKVEFDKAGSLNKAEDERLLKVMSKIPANKESSTGGSSTQADK